MYELEDISENMNDGFTWLSAIKNMECYRVQYMFNDRGEAVVLHVYDQEDNIQDMSEHEELINQIEGETV